MQLNQITGHKPEHRTMKPSLNFSLPQCLIGVEIELENPNISVLDSCPQWWDKKADGSLRNGGIEFVLYSPLNGQDLDSSLQESHSILNNKCVFSHRTSVHVHIDCRDLDTNKLFNFFMVYVIFERALFRLLNNGRENNIFCLPVYKAEFGWEDFCSLMFNEHIEDGQRRQRGFNHLDKYSAFNMLSLMDFGSVEFRHLEGTADYERIKWWINIIQSMKKYAMECDVSPIEFLSGVSERGPEAAAYEIFSRDDASLVVSYPRFIEEIFDGIRMAQDFVNVAEKKKHLHKRNIKFMEEVAKKKGCSDKFEEWCVKSGGSYRKKVDSLSREEGWEPERFIIENIEVEQMKLRRDFGENGRGPEQRPDGLAEFFRAIPEVGIDDRDDEGIDEDEEEEQW